MDFYSGRGVTKTPENASHYSLYFIGKILELVKQLRRDPAVQLSDIRFICISGEIFSGFFQCHDQ